MGVIALMLAQGASSGPPPGPTYSPWDVSSLPANVTASSGDFGLFRSGGTNATRIVVHPVTRSSGKYALRFAVSKTGTGSASGVGIRIDPDTGTYLGANANGWVLFLDNITGGDEGAFHNNVSTNLGNLGTANPGPLEVMMEIDLDSGEMFLGVAGTWPLSQDPETGANPIYSGITGPVTICAEMYYPGTVILKQPGSFLTPASSGYTAGWPDP